MAPSLICQLLLVTSTAAPAPPPQPLVLKADAFRHDVDGFNRNDKELYLQHIPNAAAWEFLRTNIPLLDCPDKDIEEIYYFRWWTFRKAIKQTPDGFIITEFLPPVGWAGKHNSIDCAAGHHLREGRWLNEPKYLDNYSLFWFRKGGDPRRYSFWAADSIWARYCVTGDNSLPISLLPDLIANYAEWERSHRDANGLYWQIDGLDGGEVSIGGDGYRATINSYQFGDALAIARIAELAGKATSPATIARKPRRSSGSCKESCGTRTRSFSKSCRAALIRGWRMFAKNMATHPGTSIWPTRNSPWRGNRPWTRRVSSRRSG